MSAAYAVCHFDFWHVEVLCALSEFLASHGVLYEGCVGDVGRWKPEGDVGSGWFLLVGRLGFHHLLPLDELGEFVVVVRTEVAADCFDYV